MKSKILDLMVVVAVVLGVGRSGTTQVAKANTISILALDTSGDHPHPDFDTPILDALTGTTYTEVSPSDFASADLSAYDVLYVGSTFQNGAVDVPSQAALDALNARQSDIADFVESGHGIVTLPEPVGIGRYSWLPVSVSFYGGDWGYDDVIITDPTHPVMQGLVNSGLSDWTASGHVVFKDIGLLDSVATRSSGELVTLVGSFGRGRIVLTGQDPDCHFVMNPTVGKQYKEFLQNAINWVAPRVVLVDIDIKPGSYPNSINPNAGGVIPVAILTTDILDASTVDPQTVALEGYAARGKGKGIWYGSMEDVDGDGDLDLVVQVVNEIDWAENATLATLTGETYDGIPIQGMETVNIVPQ